MTAAEAKQKTIDTIAPLLAECGALDPAASPGVCAALTMTIVTIATNVNGVPYDPDLVAAASRAMLDVIYRRTGMLKPPEKTR